MATRAEVLAAYAANPMAGQPDEEGIQYWQNLGLGGFNQTVADVRAQRPELAARIDLENSLKGGQPLGGAVPDAMYNQYLRTQTGLLDAVAGNAQSPYQRIMGQMPSVSTPVLPPTGGATGGYNPDLYKKRAEEAAAAKAIADAAAAAAAAAAANASQGDRDTGSSSGGGGGGFSGSTTDGSPSTGLASSMNEAAAVLGNLGFTTISDALASQVSPNYGNEGRNSDASQNNPDYGNEGRNSDASQNNPNYGNEGRNSDASQNNPNYGNEGRNSAADAAEAMSEAEAAAEAANAADAAAAADAAESYGGGYSDAGDAMGAAEAAASEANATDAAEGAASAEGFGGGDSDGGDSDGGDSGGGDSGDGGGGGDSGDGGGGDGGYFKGGLVDFLTGPNPKGPDDGSAYLNRGEYVIKKSSVDKYGKGLLGMINDGKISVKKIKSLLD